MYTCSFLLISRCCFPHDAFKFLLPATTPSTTKPVECLVGYQTQALSYSRWVYSKRWNVPAMSGSCGCFVKPFSNNFRTKNLFEKSWKNEDFLSANGEILHIIQGTKWDRDWLDLDLMTFRDASPKKNGDNSGYHDTTILRLGFSCFRRHSKLFIKLMELHRFFPFKSY